MEDAFRALRAEYPTVEWHLLTNRDFTEQMMKPTLEKSGTVADTSELFVRSAKLLELAGILNSEDLRQASSTIPEREVEREFSNVSTPSAVRTGFQPLVRDLMKTLLVCCPSLLDEQDKCNLLNHEYCKNVLGLQLSNLPLLRRVQDGVIISGRPRYYADEYGEFYVCSQWWKDHHTANARSLLEFVTKLAERKAGNPNTARLEKHMNTFRDYVCRSSSIHRNVP